MSHAGKLAKGGAINFSGAILFQVFNFVFLILITHSLGAEKTGVFILGLTLVTILGTLALLGLNKGVIRYINTYDKTKSHQVYVASIMKFSSIAVMAVGLILSILLILSSDLISNRIFNTPSLSTVLQIMAFSIPLYGLMLLFGAASRAFKIMSYTALVEQIFRPSLQLILTAIILLLGLELIGLSVVYVLALLASVILAYFFMLKVTEKHATDLSIVHKKALLKFSVPSSFTNLLTYAMVQTEVLLLGILSTPENVSLYYVAWRAAAFAVVFHGAIAGIFAPYVSSLLHEEKPSELNNIYKLATRWGVTVCLPLLCLLMLFPQPVMGLFGTEYSDGYVSLIIIALGLIINISVGPSGVALLMSGRSMLDLWNNLALMIIKIFLALLFIPKYGLIGAAFSSVIASSSINLLRVWQVHHLVRINPFGWSLLKPFLSAFISTILLYLLNRYVLQIEGNASQIISFTAIFLTSYIILLFLFKHEEDDKIIASKMLKTLQIKTKIY